MHLNLRLLFLASLLAFYFPVQSQLAPFCGHSEAMEALRASDPATALRIDYVNDWIRHHQSENPNPNGASQRGAPPLYAIPVVVHIVHNNGTANITDAQVQSGINHLNQAFANLGVYDPNTGVDVQIEFCLAAQDTNGAFTTGITRNVSTLTNMTSPTQDIALKNLNRWNPLDYMNVWLVRDITSASSGPGVAGYAYFPSSHGNPEDGIVMETRYFGTNTDDTKIMAHEVGHYLGLYHTFEGGCTNNDCTNQGDRVCDTPPDASTAPVSCAASPNTCNTDDDDLSANNPFRPVAQGGLGDQPDMFINYMDYGDRVCYSAFTQGQKSRMTAALTTARSSLLNSLGCASPCTNPITANFSASATNVTAGTIVNFTNSSSGATSFQWLINGAPFASTANSSYTFNAGGTFTITLEADNGDPSCAAAFSIVVMVNCPVSASFTASATATSLNAPVTFNSTSAGAPSTHTWYVNGVAQPGNSPTFNYTPTTLGGFTVQLLASNGICTDSSAFLFVRVGGCGMERFRTWYFGTGAGITFNTSPPTVLTNNAFVTQEGCATISDRNGNLLFYADTDTVFNRNHAMMPNGTGLMSNTSSSQGTILAAMPGDSSKYYVFNVMDVSSTSQAMSYSVVDMNLNGGLGNIVPSQKNIQYGNGCEEKQVAIRHANGVDLWIVGVNYANFTFQAYLVDCNGVSTTPFVSSPGSMGPQNGQGLGTLNTSPDGKHIMLCNLTRHAALYDFDNANGAVSNPTVFSNDPGQSAEFSPDNTKVYYMNRESWPWRVVQHDITSGNPSIIANNGVTVTTGVVAAMQLAPDGKIYLVTSNNELAVINNPNAVGMAAAFQANAVQLIRYPGSTLPDFLWDAPADDPLTITGPDTICANSSGFAFSLMLPACHQDSVIWTVVGNASLASSSSAGASLNSGATGTVQLIVERRAVCGNALDTLDIYVSNGPTVDLGPDQLACAPTGTVLDAGPGFASYLWQDNSISQTFAVTGPGTYWVEVTDGNGCSGRDSVIIDQFNLPAPTVNLGPDIVACGSQTFVLNAGSGNANYQWHDLSSAQTFTGWQAGTYWVTVGNGCGDFASDTVQVAFNTLAPFDLGPDTLLCPGVPIQLSVPSGYTSYFWSDSSTSNSVTTNGPGVYWVDVFDANGCYYRDSVLVSYCTQASGPGTATAGIEIFPNPARDLFFVKLTDIKAEPTFAFFNALGQRVELPAIQSTRAGLVQFSTQNLPRGVYFLVVTIQNTQFTRKVLLD